MKINWKVRAKNPQFWISILISVITPVFAYFGLTGADITTWEVVGRTIILAISNPYVCTLVIVSVWNALQDPTTAGISDSKRALAYIKPGELPCHYLDR